jgi:hypothetical protein
LEQLSSFNNLNIGKSSANVVIRVNLRTTIIVDGEHKAVHEEDISDVEEEGHKAS